MSEQPHIIRRQVVEVHLPPGTDSRAVQKRISRLCHEALAELLDAHLGRYAGQQEVQLARVELDLGTIALADLEQLLPERLARELERVLPPAGPAWDFAPPSDGGRANENTPAASTGREIDLIAYFLRSGLMPWWATPASYHRLAAAFAHAQRQDASALKRLLTELLEEPAAAERLFHACQDGLLAQLLALWLPGAGLRIQPLKDAMLGTSGTAHHNAAERAAWWHGIYQAAADERVAAGRYDALEVYQMLVQYRVDGQRYAAAKPVQAEEGILEILAEVFQTRHRMPSVALVYKEELPRQLPDSANEGRRLSAAEPPPHSLPPPAKEASPAGASRPLGPAPAANAASASENATSLGEDNAHSGDVSTQPNSSELSRQASPFPSALESARLRLVGRKDLARRVDTFSESDKISIQNTGLVLLWPFLPRFFATLGLTSEGRFPDEAAAVRACLLLQYLVRGTADDVFEAELPLNKLLCGIELAQPLPTEWVIGPDEASAATTLLEAVIQNGPLWRTLSVDGFRQAFLQREGLLSTRDGHWLLQAARETHDIIIDRLPWAVRHIKLPWMERLIFTEWQQA